MRRNKSTGYGGLCFKTRVASMLLCIFMVLGMFPIYSSATETNKTEDGLTYKIVNNNAVTITGYTDTPTSIVIPSEIEGYPVTSIAYEAFKGCSSLTSVTIPNSVISIGGYAFRWCNRLKSVYITDIGAWCRINFENEEANPLSYAQNLYLNNTLITDLVIPDGVTSINNYAFYYCSNLTTVTIPDSVVSIGTMAFRICRNLTSVTIPNSVTSIGTSAFGGCSNLTGVVLPDSVKSIDFSAFSGCSSLTSVTIPNSVTSIGASAFEDCSSLTSVTIPNSVTSIADYVFNYCSSLTSVTIPNSVTSIGSSAFNNCGLTSVSIPNSVTYIGSSAFDNCYNLIDVTLPESVTYIGYRAFHYCSRLNSVMFLGDITSIGENAFYSCDNLREIYFMGKAPTVSEASASKPSFNPSTVTLYYIEGTAGWTDSEHYDADTGTWNGYKLETWEPETIIAGGYCGGKGDGKNLTWELTADGVLTISGSGKMEDYPFASQQPWFDYNDNIKQVIISDGITTIGANAFAFCAEMESVEIGSDVITLEQGAFEGCDSLVSIEIPDSVTEMGMSVFNSCDSLANVKISNNLTTLPAYSFNYCKALHDVTIPASITEIKTNAFLNSTPLENVYFEGNAPVIVGTNSVNPSFPAAVTLYYIEDKSGWTDSEHYNATDGTWNGYKLEVWGPEETDTHPTIENFTINGQSGNTTVTEGEQITLGGLVNGNGNNLKAVSVAIRLKSNEELGGKWHTGENTNINAASYNLADFNTTVVKAGETFGNTTLTPGEYVVRVYATNQDGKGFEEEHQITMTIVEKEDTTPVVTGLNSSYEITEGEELSLDFTVTAKGDGTLLNVVTICEPEAEKQYYRQADINATTWNVNTTITDLSVGTHTMYVYATASNFTMDPVTGNNVIATIRVTIVPRDTETCEHEYEILYDENGDPSVVHGSGRWVSINEKQCKKLVRYEEKCIHCGTVIDGSIEYEDGSISDHLISTTLEFQQLDKAHPERNEKHLVVCTYGSCFNCGFVSKEDETSELKEHTLAGGRCVECGYRPLWDFETDSFSFINNFGSGSPYYVKQEHLDAWLDNLSDTEIANVALGAALYSPIDSWKVKNLRKNKLIESNGSCFGMATLMGLFRTNALSTEIFGVSSAKDLPTVVAGEDSDLESLINILQFSQHLPAIKSSKVAHEFGTDKFVSTMLEIWPRALAFDDTSVADLFTVCTQNHRLVCIGAENGSWTWNGKEYTRRIIVADPNNNSSPNYFYLTTMFDDVIYVIWDESKGEYRERTDRAKPNRFGYGDFLFDEKLLNRIKLPAVFSNKTDQADMSATFSMDKENALNLIVDFHGNPSVTISSINGSAIIENGIIVDDTIGIQLHMPYEAIEDETSSDSFYVLLPQGVDYTIISNDDASIDVMANYMGYAYGISGAVTSLKLNADRSLSILESSAEFSVDVINDDGPFDFTKFSGQAEGEITVTTNGSYQVLVSGEWDDCVASHLTRDLEESSIDVSGNEQMLLSINKNDKLSALVDLDGDGTYDKEVQDKSSDPGHPIYPVNPPVISNSSYVCPYTDISNHWAKDIIQYIDKLGLIDGATATTFAPDKPMTREVFVTAVARLAGVKSDYINWAIDIGLLKGYGNGEYGLNDTITREQMAVFFLRFLELTDVDYEDCKTVAQYNFADHKQIADWAQDAVYEMQALDLIHGKGDRLFDPKGLTTRAEGATVLYNMCKTVLKK